MEKQLNWAYNITVSSACMASTTEWGGHSYLIRDIFIAGTTSAIQVGDEIKLYHTHETANRAFVKAVEDARKNGYEVKYIKRYSEQFGGK